MIVGAYLTQNTSWTNVEHALRRLRGAGLLSVAGIRRTALPELESLIRSAGYFRQKAQRLKTFVAFLDEHYGGSVNRMFAQTTEKLRVELLALNGVGPETADSILLYAGNHPVFVVDAYTRRILERHGIVTANVRYEEIRWLLEHALSNFEHALSNEVPTPPATPRLTNAMVKINPIHRPSLMSTSRRSNLVQIYNEMHGLIVGVGKHYCLKSHPRCDECPFPAKAKLRGRSRDVRQRWTGFAVVILAVGALVVPGRAQSLRQEADCRGILIGTAGPAGAVF